MRKLQKTLQLTQGFARSVEASLHIINIACDVFCALAVLGNVLKVSSALCEAVLKTCLIANIPECYLCLQKAVPKVQTIEFSHSLQCPVLESFGTDFPYYFPFTLYLQQKKPCLSMFENSKKSSKGMAEHQILLTALKKLGLLVSRTVPVRLQGICLSI